jgi:rhodanese-related sulfurtransferase
MRRNLTLLTILFAALFAKGQNKVGFETMVNTLLSNAVDTIDSAGLYRQLERGEICVLDAREGGEFNVSHLKGAIHVGYNDFDRKALAHIPKDAPIAVYCSVGKRSEDIALKLKAKGYTNVKNHWGGIFDWTNRNLPVENSEGQPVKLVHPYNTLWGVWINNYQKAYEPR